MTGRLPLLIQPLSDIIHLKSRDVTVTVNITEETKTSSSKIPPSISSSSSKIPLSTSPKIPYSMSSSLSDQDCMNFVSIPISNLGKDLDEIFGKPTSKDYLKTKSPYIYG